MKKRILPLALAGCLLLSGCRAMLERSYSAAAPHVDHPVTAEDPSVLRVENYRELVSAVLYLVSEGEEEGPSNSTTTMARRKGTCRRPAWRWLLRTPSAPMLWTISSMSCPEWFPTIRLPWPSTTAEARDR